MEYYLFPNRKRISTPAIINRSKSWPNVHNFPPLEKRSNLKSPNHVPPSWQTRMTANTTQCGEGVPNMAAPENIVPPVNDLEGHAPTMNKYYHFLGHYLFTWAVLFDQLTLSCTARAFLTQQLRT